MEINSPLDSSYLGPWRPRSGVSEVSSRKSLEVPDISVTFIMPIHQSAPKVTTTVPAATRKQSLSFSKGPSYASRMKIDLPEAGNGQSVSVIVIGL